MCLGYNYQIIFGFCFSFFLFCFFFLLCGRRHVLTFTTPFMILYIIKYKHYVVGTKIP